MAIKIEVQTIKRGQLETTSTMNFDEQMLRDYLVHVHGMVLSSVPKGTDLVKVVSYQPGSYVRIFNGETQLGYKTPDSKILRKS